jgi:hypothetical protein
VRVKDRWGNDSRERRWRRWKSSITSRLDAERRDQVVWLCAVVRGDGGPGPGARQQDGGVGTQWQPGGARKEERGEREAGGGRSNGMWKDAVRLLSNRCVAILPAPMAVVSKVINMGSATIKSRQSRNAGVSAQGGGGSEIKARNGRRRTHVLAHSSRSPLSKESTYGAVNFKYKICANEFSIVASVQRSV